MKSQRDLVDEFDRIIKHYTWITNHDIPITHIMNEDMRVIKTHSRFLVLTQEHKRMNMHPVFLKMLFYISYERQMLTVGLSDENNAPHPFEIEYAKFLLSLDEKYLDENDKEVVTSVTLRKLINTK